MASPDGQRAPSAPSQGQRQSLPKDPLGLLLNPLLNKDAEWFQDNGPETWPSLDETLQWRRDGTPDWWADNQDLREREDLQGLGRRSWRSEDERRTVLYEQVRAGLRLARVSWTTPRTIAEQQLVSTASAASTAACASARPASSTGKGRNRKRSGPRGRIDVT